MASVSLVSRSETSLTVRIVGLELDYWNNWGTSNLPRHVGAVLSISGHGTYQVGKGSSSGTTTSATFSGLSPSTTYYVMGVVVYKTTDGTDGSSNIGGYFSTDASPEPQIPKWYWSNAQTEPIASGQPAVVRASAWNSMVGKIEQIKGSQIPNLKVSVGQKASSAALYNSVVSELKAFNPSAPISPVIAHSSSFSAKSLLDIQTAINWIIDRL